ncbi:FadR/GntR family transcriptional regulator [Streptomyces sp. NPDC056255]|uniref:FadR/GntR family transcriptional regulator n=1 Tax=Streptomyces sp. NPDC056255 TaxID=3345764 RepID=UPI0035DFA7D5
MKSVGRVSIVDTVINELRGEIARGTWQVGDRIPTESRLAEIFGVSRLSVREAVRVLVHAELLTTRQGNGTFVTATDEGRVALRRRLDRARTTDILDVRRGLDIVAARLAATMRTEEDLASLQEAMERRTAAGRAGDLDTFTDADVDFHLRIAEASHNPLLSDLYRNMSDALWETVKANQCIDEAGDDPFHTALYEAVRNGDPAAATAAALAILDDYAAEETEEGE